MTQLNIIDIKGMIHGAGLSEEVSPVASVLEGYQALVAKTDRTLDDDKLLFEVAMAIGQHGFGGIGAEAFQVVATLIDGHGLATFREPEPEPPEVDPAEV